MSEFKLVHIREDYAPKLDNSKKSHEDLKIDNSKKSHEDRNLQSIKEHLQKIYEKIGTRNDSELEVHSLILNIKSIEESVSSIEESVSSLKNTLSSLEDKILIQGENIQRQNNLLQIELESIKKTMETLTKLAIEEREITKIDHSKDLECLLLKSKNEYISAMQCEMEICRSNIIKEFYRSNKGLKGHGDPFFNL